jgi:hypothetical protein
MRVSILEASGCAGAKTSETDEPTRQARDRTISTGPAGDAGGAGKCTAERPMIICSCTVISDRDIEGALLEILSQPDAPIPTPGVVYRHLSKRMNCCSCAPLAVETIYNKVDELEKKGLISPNVCATTRSKLLEFSAWRARLRDIGADQSLLAAPAKADARKVA